jgi:phage/conjugal plasmid C-4 type zinc finger TraR family protein
MSDIIDQAQECDEIFRQSSLQNHFKNKIATPPESRLAMTNRECEDCGEPIPPKRLKVNPEATRCVTCQTLAEKNGRMDE